jgi:hypothetical protein
MSPDDQLLYESRVRNRQAAVAVLAGVLLIVASVIQLGGPHTSVDELTQDLLTANKRFPLDLVAAIVNAVASIGIAWTLVFLYRATKARNAEVRPFIRWLAIAGGGLSAVAGVIYAVIVAVKVHQFATTGSQTYDQATHLTSGAGLLVLQLAGQLAALIVAVSFVLVCMQALRVGLLTKFMGYLGMFAGAPGRAAVLAGRRGIPDIRPLADGDPRGMAYGSRRAVAFRFRTAGPAGGCPGRRYRAPGAGTRRRSRTRPQWQRRAGGRPRTRRAGWLAGRTHTAGAGV